MNKIMLVAILALALGGCASADKRRSSYDELYARALNEINVAKQMGFLWRDTQKYLRLSREAHDRGDKKKAKALAEKALNEARLAQEQARQQSNPDVSYPPI